jgi:hypothetical protein
MGSGEGKLSLCGDDGWPARLSNARKKIRNKAQGTTDQLPKQIQRVKALEGKKSESYHADNCE